jgi:iron complex outermembrane recepter protein
MFKKTKVCSGLMLAFGGSVLLGALPAQAQQQLERVEITGSSIRRLSAEGALPVSVLKVDELTKQGVTSTEQAMAFIASVQSNFGASAAIGGTTGGKSEADLRGLSGPTGGNANKTLVLLNGRRLANHAFDAAAVDLNAIPFSAIDRIEVLRDGASAIYGTDAIGGVINFITKAELVGFDVSAQATKPQRDGGGDTKRVSLSGGFGSLAEQRFNIQASFDYRKQKVLMAEERDFSKTGIIRGAVTAGTSGTSFPGDLNGFEPTLPTCNPPASVPNPAGTACRYDFSHDVDILTENEQKTYLVKGSVAVTPDNTLSLEYLRANNKSTARVAPAPTSSLIPTTSPYWLAGATPTSIPNLNNPGNPNGATACGFDNCVPGGAANWRQVPAGKRTSGDDTTTDRVLLELQGAVKGWDYRTGFGTTQNKSEANVKRGYVNDGLIQDGVFNGIINPFGPQTAAGQAAIEAAQVVAPTQIGKNKVTFFDFRVSKADLAQLPAGPLGIAFGVEFRKEKSGFEALDITSQLGSLGIDPDSDTSGSRKVGAAFAELNIPIVKDLEMSLAARYDKYSDFGNTVNPKVGLRYQPTKELLFRGSAATGFRAPTLYEIYQPQSLTFTTDSYNDPVYCPNGTAIGGSSAGVVCDQQVMQRNVGPAGNGQSASALEPEKSKSFSLGVGVEPTKNLTFSADLWRLQIKNLISGLPEQEIFGSSARYTSRFVRCSQIPATGAGITRDDIDACTGYPGIGYDPIAYIDTPTENLGEQRVNGIDVNFQWRSDPTPAGVFGLRGDGTYITSYKYQREKGGAYISAVGRYSDNAPVFRWQHVLTGSWNQGPWGATLTQRYKSAYKDQDGVNEVASYSLFDASVTWSGVKNLSVTFGVNNLLDTDPPLSGQVTTFQRGYDPRFTDPLGRTFVLRAAYKFF